MNIKNDGIEKIICHLFNRNTYSGVKENKSNNPKGVLVYFRESFLNEIDRTFAENGIKDRATFIRLAAYNELIKLGNKGIPISYINPPLRAGAEAAPPSRKKGKSKREEAPVASDSWEWPYKGLASAGKTDRFDLESTSTVSSGKKPKKGYFAVKINGQAMKPEFEHGSLVEVKPLKNGEVPKVNRVYLWYVKSEGYVIRRLVQEVSPTGRAKKNPSLTLTADNPRFSQNIAYHKATPIGEITDSLSQ